MKYFFLLLLPILVSGMCLGNTYYVSPSGNDANDGLSPANAWQTFTNVNQYVADTIFSVGDQVLLERGQTFRGQINFLVRLDSVTGNFFTFGAYGTGPNPIIMGSETLTGWTQHSGNIYYTNSALPVKQLFVGENRMTLARYPNTGFLTNDSYGGATSLTDSDLTEPAGYWVGATLRIRPVDYVYEHTEVTTHTAGGNLGFSPRDYDTSPGVGYFLDNKLELLDVENEWYYDASTQRVYFYAPGGVNPNTLNIEGSVYDYGFKGWYDLRTMTFENIVFRNQSLEAIWLQGLDCLGNTIRDCEFYGQGLIAVDVMGRDITVENNIIDDVMGQGIAGFQIRDSRITGNNVNRIGMWPGFGINAVGGMIGIKVLQSDSLYIANNIVDSTGYAAIEAKMANSLLEYNHLTNSVLKLSDGGALETFGPDVTNNIFRHNVIEIVEGYKPGLPPGKDLIINAIYLDNDISNITVDSNVVRMEEHGGILLNSGTRDCKIRDNIIYGGSEQLVIAEWREPDSTGGHEVFGNVFYGLDAFSKNIRLVSNFNTEDNLASLDSNYYCNPYTDFILERGGLSGNTPRYSFEQWKSISPVQNLESKDSYHNFVSYQVNANIGGNMLSNGDFASNNSGWFCDPHQFGGSNGVCNWQSSGGLDGGCYNYELLSSTPRSEGSITSPDLVGGLVAGAVYKLSFSIISPNSGNVRVVARRNGGNYAYLDPSLTFSFGPTRKDVTAFYPSGITEPNVRLEFIISYDNGREITLDNVVWQEVDVTPIDPTTMSVLFSNPTNSPVTIPLSQAYLDLDSAAVTGSITLPPFYGKVLIVDPNGNPFPTEVLRFDAHATPDPATDLSWTIGTSEGLDYVTVERSYDGQRFSSIGKKTYEASQSLYEFRDENPFGEKFFTHVFYRLKMVDLDGQFDYSSVEAVTFTQGIVKITLAPNPAKESIQITHPFGAVFFMEMLDATGKKLHFQKINGMAQVKIDHLVPGIYLVRFWEESGLNTQVVTRKLIVE